eukprot:1532632-Pyramimonas_sp.AAC.1
MLWEGGWEWMEPSGSFELANLTWPPTPPLLEGDLVPKTPSEALAEGVSKAAITAMWVDGDSGN